jgi:hypothetical protein
MVSPKRPKRGQGGRQQTRGQKRPAFPSGEALVAGVEKKFVSGTYPLLVANEEWRRESRRVEWRASLS